MLNEGPAKRGLRVMMLRAVEKSARSVSEPVLNYPQVSSQSKSSSPLVLAGAAYRKLRRGHVVRGTGRSRSEYRNRNTGSYLDVVVVQELDGVVVQHIVHVDRDETLASCYSIELSIG